MSFSFRDLDPNRINSSIPKPVTLKNGCLQFHSNSEGRCLCFHHLEVSRSYTTDEERRKVVSGCSLYTEPDSNCSDVTAFPFYRNDSLNEKQMVYLTGSGFRPRDFLTFDMRFDFVNIHFRDSLDDFERVGKNSWKGILKRRFIILGRIPFSSLILTTVRYVRMSEFPRVPPW